jgi:glutaredoxin
MTNSTKAEAEKIVDVEQALPVKTRLGKVTVVTDLDAYEGLSYAEKVDSFVQKHPVVMVNRSWCLFSTDALEFLVQLGVTVYSLEVDKHPQGALILKHLTKKWNHNTYVPSSLEAFRGVTQRKHFLTPFSYFVFSTPMIFISGKFLGGFEDVNAMYATGKLQSDYLEGLSNAEKCEKMAALATRHPFFFFPAKVNGNVVRGTGILTCLVAVACVVLSWLTSWGQYIALYLVLEFILRILAGSRLSLLGQLATLLTLTMEPEPRSGPPKQFACLCGFMFSFLGASFYCLGFRFLGSVFIGGLAIASGMEGFLDHCLGCVFFRLGMEMGLISK